MKKLLPWLKSNWLIVVLGVIAVAALPALWFVSSGMNQTLMEKFQKQVETDFKDVSNGNTTYELTSPTGEKLLTESKPVNKARTDAYKAIGEQLAASTGVVSKAAFDLNTAAGAHKPLIEGLFPAPSELQKLSKPTDFVRKLLREERPRMLAEIKAGAPPAPETVAASLNDRSNAEKDRVRTEQGRDQLDSKELETLAADLLALRLSIYQGRASEIQVYADERVFDEIPLEAIDKTASLAQVYDWQERTWIASDILAAIKQANGESRGVPQSVVKRVMAIRVEDAPFSSKNADGNVEPHAFEAGADRAPTDFSRSITGRFSGPGSNNRWYDVRHVTIELIADAKRLPVFVDALASSNFMTVVDADLTRVDPVADLREGFYYGDAPVVKATMVVETIYFREWREPWMPVDVKRALGMDKDAPAADTPAPRATPRGPANRPAPPPPGGAAGGGRRRGGNGDGGGD